MSTPPYLVTGVGSHLKVNPLLSCGIRARNLSLWDHQFTPTFDPSKVMAQGGRGGFHTFTREFYHPDDRVPSCSPEAAERFYADSRRFPPGSYESHSLLWRRDEWRQPNSAERCATMCIPPAAVMSVNTPPAKREQQRNSLIGNGFHIPSIMILLTLLPHLLQAKFVHPTIDPGDGVLQARLQGTVWEPGRLDVWPHLLDAADVVRLLPIRVSPTLLSLMNSLCRCTIVLHTVASADYRSLRCGSRCVGNPLPPWGRHLSSDVTALSSIPACPANVILLPALVALITFYHQVSGLKHIWRNLLCSLHLSKPNLGQKPMSASWWKQ